MSKFEGFSLDGFTEDPVISDAEPTGERTYQFVGPSDTPSQPELVSRSTAQL